MTDLSDFTRKHAIYSAAIATSNERNKTIVFDALHSAGITRIHIEFDGEGDSGQIETVQAYAGDQPVDIATAPVMIEHARWGESEASVTEEPLSEAIETLCYGFLAQEHDGWENNDGAYGEFEFDVAERTITLEFNGRYTDVNTSNYSF